MDCRKHLYPPVKTNMFRDPIAIYVFFGCVFVVCFCKPLLHGTQNVTDSGKKAVLVSKGMRSIVSDDNEAAHLICYNPSCGSRVQFGIIASVSSKRRDTLMTFPSVQYLPPRLSHTPSFGFQRPSLRREPQTETLGLLSLSSE